MLTRRELDHLSGLIDRLDYAYWLWFEHDHDQHAKSSEGRVTIEFPSYWDRSNGETEPKVVVYSYVFGPRRTHDFDSVDEAVNAVRAWVDEYLDYLLCEVCGKPRDNLDGPPTTHKRCTACM